MPRQTKKKHDMPIIQRLVGNITEEELRHVDCYVSERLGIFIPSVGFCEYAITPSHTHPSYSFVVFFTKEQSFFTDNIELPEDHYLAAVMEPEAPHEEKPSDTFRRYLAIFIPRDIFEGLYQDYSKNKPIPKLLWKQFAVGHELMIYIKNFMSEYENKSPGYKTMLDALAVLISHCFIRSLLEIDMKTDVITEKFEIEGMIQFMEQHFGQKMTITELSKQSNMSESHFMRIFKRETGLSPMDYLIRIRIEKAKKLLRIGKKNMTEVSQLCGFGSPSHFSSSFAKHTGVSPTEYQRAYTQNH